MHIYTTAAYLDLGIQCSHQKAQDVLASLGQELDAAEALSRVRTLLNEVPLIELKVPFEKVVM